VEADARKSDVLGLPAESSLREIATDFCLDGKQWIAFYRSPL
jgi:hypothetical protein